MTAGITGVKGRLTVVAAAAVGIVLSACGAGQIEAATPEPVGADVTPTELEPAEYSPDPNGRVPLPLEGYQDRLAAATGGLTSEVVECFADVGVDLTEAGVEVGHAEEQPDRRYSVVEEGIAARYGYHAPPTTDPRDRLLDAADEDQLVAVSDCIAELPEPGPEIAKGEQLISDIQAEAWWAAQREPRVVDAFAAWSSCMSRSGYTYERPMDANDDPRWATDKASAAEITVAKADVACKAETDLVAIWSRAEAEHQEALVEEHAAELRDYDITLNR